MKFLKIIIIVLEIYISFSYKIRSEEDKYIVKLENNLMKKLSNKKNKIDFKNLLFKQIEQNKNRYLMQKKNITKLSHRLKHSSQEVRIYKGDYVSTFRTVRFIISKYRECSILVNDTLVYINLAKVNLIEHMILHNNGETIDPIGVYSDKVNISFFAFNKKLNLFSVYFDNNEDNKEFSIEYDFIAENILKSKIERANYNSNVSTKSSERVSPFVITHKNNFSNEDTSINHTINNNQNFNWFVWKILNENFMKKEENLKIEVLFDVGDNFDQMKIDFSLNFKKSSEIVNKVKMLKYSWKGTLKPSQMLVLECKFPLIFEKCGAMNLNFLMIMIGSIFILFLIAILHMILSNVFFEDF